MRQVKLVLVLDCDIGAAKAGEHTEWVLECPLCGLRLNYDDFLLGEIIPSRLDALAAIIKERT